MKKSKCLYCYQPVEDGKDFHPSCSKEFFGRSVPPRLEYELSEIKELARVVVKHRVAVPGVQPKLSLSTVSETVNKSDARLTVLGVLDGQYIFKPPNSKYPEMPENEHFTMRLAESFGIRTVKSSLIRLASGELGYVTKRIDRTETNEKVHMLDMFQITESFDKYLGSMEKVGKAIEKYAENSLLDLVYFYDLCLFSFLVGNNDMHLKNFSMIKSEYGWKFAPAYDLLNVAILLPDDKEEMALSVVGKKRKLQQSHFTELGLRLGLTEKQIAAAYKRMQKGRKLVNHLITQSYLSPETREAYVETLNRRYNQIDL
jgi:serine/threonine-protein kinase HipA